MKHRTDYPSQSPTFHIRSPQGLITMQLSCGPLTSLLVARLYLLLLRTHEVNTRQQRALTHWQSGFQGLDKQLHHVPSTSLWLGWFQFFCADDQYGERILTLQEALCWRLMLGPRPAQTEAIFSSSRNPRAMFGERCRIYGATATAGGRQSHSLPLPHIFTRISSGQCIRFKSEDWLVDVFLAHGSRGTATEVAVDRSQNRNSKVARFLPSHPIGSRSASILSPKRMKLGNDSKGSNAQSASRNQAPSAETVTTRRCTPAVDLAVTSQQRTPRQLEGNMRTTRQRNALARKQLPIPCRRDCDRRSCRCEQRNQLNHIRTASNTSHGDRHLPRRILISAVFDSSGVEQAHADDQ